MDTIFAYLKYYSEAVMAFTSIAMLVVSGLLAWNAIKMRALNQQSIKVSLWNHRYEVYKGLLNWLDKLTLFLDHADSETFIVQEVDQVLDRLGIQKIDTTLQKGVLLFTDDEWLTQFFKDYLEKLFPITTNYHDNLYNSDETLELLSEVCMWQIHKMVTLNKIIKKYLDM